MQTRLEPLPPHKYDGPQVNIAGDTIQTIEISRGCRRHCVFCHADPAFREFPIPELTRNLIHIIGEGFSYDSRLPGLLDIMGSLRVNGKVARYGLSQGIDYRLTSQETAEALSRNRFGIINSHGRWSKGMRIAWDWGIAQKPGIEEAIRILNAAGYLRQHLMVFMLTNWKISYEECSDKLYWLRKWGVKVDDTTWETTKRQKIPLHWTAQELRAFRAACRLHNQLIICGRIKAEDREPHKPGGQPERPSVAEAVPD